MRYSEILASWLKELGYTHCFFVAGGNIMHILASVSSRFTCVPVVHEVAAGIAVEYFNETRPRDQGRAFALVTAGPGLTNIVTAIAGSWLESRELLVLGGQVKTVDLSRNQVRQRGIQEIGGVDIVRPITVRAVTMDRVMGKAEFAALVQADGAGRKGPVFIELPLDIQGSDVLNAVLEGHRAEVSMPPPIPAVPEEAIYRLVEDIRAADRPMLLIGGGVTRETARVVYDQFSRMGVPLTTTWNGADRIGADHPLYFGRPNTWGQRYSNLLIQQSDLIVALGSRLGLQQTGFNWQKFGCQGRLVQVDCDKAELNKGHPRVDVPLLGDANGVLRRLAATDLGKHSDWVAFCRMVKRELPLMELGNNKTGAGYISPYAFVDRLSGLCGDDDVVVPCSSGGAFTVMMQVFAQKRGQLIVTDKGLASMGYGLSGAIGAAFSHPTRRVILVEGDGGFSQNLQELGTVSTNQLNLKVFIFCNEGYASIRMTQRNYSGGNYVGCDFRTGLGMPDWAKLFDAYGIPTMRVGPGFEGDPVFEARFRQPGPTGFIVGVDPEQTYLPKISSRVTAEGSMESNPLHRMSPDLPDDMYQRVAAYIVS